MVSSMLISSLITLLLSSFTTAQSISSINGNRFVSPLRNQPVANVTGLVTAVGPDGFWLRSTTPDRNRATSESIYVFTSGDLEATIGDIISVNGTVTEFRSSSNPTYLFLAEITRPSITDVLSTDNPVVPLVIGKDTNPPPTQQYTSLDNGDIFSLPNNQSLLTVVNPVLSPNRYGLDFWESLLGELVTIRTPIAINRPNSFGDVWVRSSSWPTTNLNSRGGLTITDADANPETIIIGTPLDGSDNPLDTKLGDALADITGVVYYAFGFYRILPTTAVSVTLPNTPAPGPATLVSNDTCGAATIGSYNVENLNPASDNLPLIAEHIVTYLHSPPLVFLQEIQDNNGETNDGVVSADVTLQTLADAITSLGGPAYSSVVIDPVDGQDGGAPGANIRVAYFYNPEFVELVGENPGGSLDAVAVVEGDDGAVRLNFNPGRIEPDNVAWEASRKPLVAQWRFVDGGNSTTATTTNSTASSTSDRRPGSPWNPPPKPPSPSPTPGPSSGTFFTINVHLTSKGGSSSTHGDPRPPINGGVEQRLNQTSLITSFIQTLLSADPAAKIVAAGDWNEFVYVEPLERFVEESTLVDVDDVAGLKLVERYTYLFDGNSQALDHVFLSDGVIGKGGRGASGSGNGNGGGRPGKPGRPGGPGGPGGPGNGNGNGNGGGSTVQVEHVHVNTWVTFNDQASDHDPTVVKLNLC